MAIRKAKVRRGVNSVGVKKHKIAGRFGNKNFLEYIEQQLPQKCVDFLYKLSGQCFLLFTKMCCNLNFIPISLESDMKMTVRKTKWQLLAHYSVMTLQAIRLLHIFWVTTNRVLDKGLDFEMVLCLSSLVPYILCFSLPLSLLFQPYETAQVLNTIPVLLSFYPKNGKTPTLFQNAKNTTFILVLTFIAGSGALLASAFGFLVDDLPVSLYHIVESTTDQPELIPLLLWKLAYWPMELIMFLHTTTLTAYATMIVITFPNTGLVCSSEMRKVPVSSAGSWVELRRKYYLLQVYSCTLNSWVNLMIVPTIFSVVSAITVGIYVTLKYSGLPILIHLGFAWIGFSFLVLCFWFLFEVLSFIQSTEAIVETLSRRHDQYFMELSRTDRLYLIKCGKATRQLVFQVGDFTDFSIGVITAIWDEILNQLLFLLTF